MEESTNIYYDKIVDIDNNRQISLKSLESMRQRGLISEETYIKKVQELGY